MPNNDQVVFPYEPQGSKKEQVAEMFDNISGKYDFLNHFLSLGIDRLWRKRAIKLIAKETPACILDVATGTGDLAVEACQYIKPEKMVGVDISRKMLDEGRQKIQKAGLEHVIDLKYGDAEELPFKSNTFDVVMVAYGVRNFENTDKGLLEMQRVLKDGGLLLILEFSKPKNFPFKQMFSIYFKFILPLFGKLISKDKRAYKYLPESVEAFPDGKQFTDGLNRLNFKEAKCISLTFGISSIYLARK